VDGGHRVGARSRDATGAALTPHGVKVRLGQERARARGVRFGRPRNPRLTPEALERAQAMLDAGMCLRAIATELRVPKTTLYRALHRELGEGRGDA